jgi:hypothetical protein
MGRRLIGQATREGTLPSKGGVVFGLPYDNHDYNIFLSNQELDGMLLSGLQKILKNQWPSHTYGDVRLEPPDLPLFVGPRTIDITSKESGLHSVSMKIGIVTASVVHEQRGLLTVDKDCSGEWNFIEYERRAELREDPLTIE